MSFARFGIYWFGLGILWTVIYIRITRNFHLFGTLTRKGGGLLVLLGLMSMLSTYFFFLAIHTIANPGLVSFIGNITPALVITLSVLVLKERFGMYETLGVLLALTGAFVISYRGGMPVGEIFLPGTQYILYGGLINAVSAIIIKKYINSELPPVVLTVNRLVFLWILSVVALIVSGEDWKIPHTALQNIVIGSVLGPFLTAVTGYLALQYIPLSHKAVIGSMKGVFVLLGSYLFFGLFPGTIKLLGGAISILGVLLISFGRMKRK